LKQEVPQSTSTFLSVKKLGRQKLHLKRPPKTSFSMGLQQASDPQQVSLYASSNYRSHAKAGTRCYFLKLILEKHQALNQNLEDFLWSG